MTASEIIKKVVDEKSACLIRLRKGYPIKGEPIQYDVKPIFTGNKKHWIMLDLTTASAMLACYNALKDTGRDMGKWDRIWILKLVDFTWSNVK
jgi:hypothetical protein